MTVHLLVREQIRARARGRCERCGKSLANVPASIHHRRPRGMGGSKDPVTNTLPNLVLLCGSGTTGCHGWIESNRAEAYATGWLVHQGHNPADTPITRNDTWYLLDSKGWTKK